MTVEIVGEIGTGNAFAKVDGNDSDQLRYYPKGIERTIAGKFQSTDIFVRGKEENGVNIHFSNEGSPTDIVVDMKLSTLRLAAELLGYRLVKNEE
jgi:hypothetical protein